ncbi:RtcB family protein [bacterium CG_4_10_14_0_2_um_filter_33_32]|nr:MAG: RNA-splicing ligase RtcB [bacterium CG2_30_33_46]PIU76874.1 MAG: RtcB family protein [bacterium CG06_land_8_20_14_3_00_33_50]PIW81681.1 MAG: RtcB family protein [bacterium CG_4_8_14_3_um_filter_33_28]PIY84991.1 MAG: RtcB family protein [bacterium CG_4_10_14_0_8_um_filter_33_57]PIZ86551.1 MAG: RtcB family protein [bacterium CG_4_10_14_0_2_um_filter_33_32]PJA72206.1 MAG: RtcB family protein [bacterium CG_4_9_14_3_um_filter_33_26]
MIEIKSEKLPIYLWAKDIEEGALMQANNLANHPFAFHHIAIMPDVHEGYGMPIGGVLATEKVIIPNAVGVDIGCGVTARKTSLKGVSKEDLKNILGKIREEIPVGFAHYKVSQDKINMPKFNFSKEIEKEYESALHQVGTLGGGNHFIEIQKDSKEYIWIMVHSGSRNLGFKVAHFYNHLAKELNKKNKIKISEKWDLCYLVLQSKEGKSYWQDMNFCLQFAYNSRSLMLSKISKIFEDHFPTVEFEKEINIHHNYASLEKHFGKEVIVHRKGAISAVKDQIGLVPGSQGTHSYLIKGLGNTLSFNSCAHGAGRRMSRKEARRSLSLEEEKSKLDKKGILHAIRGKRDLDEAASAYKNIEEVMDKQKDLAQIIEIFAPLAVVKG